MGMVVLLSDRTDETQLELALTRANEASLDRADELEARAREKTRFLANMSHELRSPLSSVVGIAELLKDNLVEPLSSEEQDLSRQIHELGTGLLQQINQLLDFEKAEAGALELVLEDVQPGPFVGELQTALNLLLSATGLNFDVRTSADEDVVICLDTRKTRQMIMSTATFVCATSQADATLHVSLHVDAKGLSASFVQSGTDVHLPDASVLRDPFLRIAADANLPATREQRVGMALVTRLVELHHGTIAIQQRAAGWISYKIRLPNLARRDELS